LLNVGMGVLMAALAIPMILQRVRPNMWYGFRTRKTLSDERIWYPANRYAGQALLIGGAVVALSGLVLYLVAGSAAGGALQGEVLSTVLWLVTLFVPLAATVTASLVYVRRL
jgi:uncharacterized membrane protein